MRYIEGRSANVGVAFNVDKTDNVTTGTPKVGVGEGES
jgi:hypothetical protein